jgi:plastocyanin
VTRRIIQLVRLITVPALLALGTVSAPAVSAGNPCFHGFEMPPASIGSGSDIKLMPCAFEPTVLQVAEGTEVTFVNGPDFTHLITGADQAWGSPDVEVQPGVSISYTFNEAGVYPYACALHPGMSGAIVVGDLDQALAVGSTGASNAGGSSGASAQGESGSADAAPADAAEARPADAAQAGATASSTAATPPVVALGIGAGLVVGAAAVWLAIRRRTPGDRALLHAE